MAEDNKIEEAKNVIRLIELLKRAQEEQETMTDQEREDNAVQMGDIYY